MKIVQMLLQLRSARYRNGPSARLPRPLLTQTRTLTLTLTLTLTRIMNLTQTLTLTMTLALNPNPNPHPKPNQARYRNRFWREADGSVLASWFPGRGHSVTGKAARVGARTRG